MATTELYIFIPGGDFMYRKTLAAILTAAMTVTLLAGFGRRYAGTDKSIGRKLTVATEREPDTGGTAGE